MDGKMVGERVSEWEDGWRTDEWTERWVFMWKDRRMGEKEVGWTDGNVNE
jgi:hypothetical protein